MDSPHEKSLEILLADLNLVAASDGRNRQRHEANQKQKVADQI